MAATYLTGPRGPEYRRDDETGAVRWYVYDGLGSVVGEVAPDGSLTCTRKLDVYGCVRSSTGTATSKHKFVGSLGHPSDDETGLIYMRARHYDPVCGRFISEDPAGDGKNWFVYCGDNPANGTDSSGEFVDILVGLLVDADDNGRDAATAQAVKEWGVDKIMSAVAKFTGEITGYLIADELDDSGYTNVGIFLKVGDRQINIDFLNEHGHGTGGPHIDFQPEVFNGKKYAKLYLEGLVEGLEEAL